MMKYQINMKADINEGTVITIRIPVAEVDKNALLAMGADMPPFVVPFTYRHVNDDIELIYMIRRRSLLRYYSGKKSVDDFCDIFTKLLQPMQSCVDWFMNPFSFVLKYEHLYYDLETNTIAFLYIPSVECCSGPDDLLQMVKQVERDCPVDDDTLRVKILEMFTTEFRVRDFLHVIQSASRSERIVPEVIKAKEELPNSGAVVSPERVPEQPVPVRQPDVKQPERDDMDDLEICFPDAPKQETKAKGEKKQGFLGGLFSKKPKKEPENKPKRHVFSGAGAEAKAEERVPEPAREDISEWFDEDEDEKTRVKKKYGAKVPRLVCIGDPSLPKVIEIRLNSSNMFRIGRFDVRLGRKQSEFEFHENTLEVSRHHAAIELVNGTYYITDIGSQQGTIVDGRFLTPNDSAALANGTKVSFGEAGADYRFEC